MSSQSSMSEQGGSEPGMGAEGALSVNSYILQQNLPNVELILFPDSNHGSHFQFTERFNRYAADFVDS
jgi:pimeloyl-ACP methyl ester carboxylesterase